MAVVRKIVLFLPLTVALALPGLGTLIAAIIVATALVFWSDARRATSQRGPWLRSLGIGALGGVCIALLMQFVVNPW